VTLTSEPPAPTLADGASPRAPEPVRRAMWSRMAPLLGDRWSRIGVLVVLSVLSGLAESGILAVVAQTASSLVDHRKVVHASLGHLRIHTTDGVLLGVAGALAALRLLLQLPISLLPARISADVQARLRKQLFETFTRASWSAQSRDREGHLQEMATNQVMQASFGALHATNLAAAGSTFLVLVLSALALNLMAAAAVLGAAVLLFAILRPLNALGARKARALSQAQMGFASGIGEATRIAEETQVFGVSAEQRARVDHQVDVTRGYYFDTQLLARLIPNVYQSLVYVILVGGLAALYLAGSGGLASLGAVVLLLVRAGAYGQQMQAAYQMIRQAVPFVERLHDAQESYAASEPELGDRPLDTVQTIAFEDTSFAYANERPAVTDLSFELSRGEAIGIIGPSGAGKSTIVQLLLRLRRPDSGRFLVNGISADHFAAAEWPKKFAYVPQEPRLLHASVADNIKYYRELDDAAVERAARLACIHDDIASWPQSYDTIIGPRADAISGGQQQRMCLARALAGRPDVLVLDEPTSALDPRSEALLHESLVRLRGSVTLLIVAHRMMSLAICGRVMVIVDGRLEAFEPTGQLHLTSSYYRVASTLTGAGLQDTPTA
jgi:ATP-binding cassette subfamily B protein